ncbi:Altered inheritance of mitochondria protein 24, mitochondrial, partial [Cryomyces antarcticus]
LFLKFQGPSTILLQSRASRISDVLTARDIAEIADSPAGAAQSTVQLRLSKEGGHGSSNSATSAAPPPPPPPTSIKYATVKSDGKVEIRDS